MMEQRPTSNAEIAQFFSNIAELLDIKGEEWYRVRAYRRAAESIAHYPEEMIILRERGRLEEIPGVGKAIAGKIDELLRTGRMEFYQRLQSEIPDGVLSLLGLPGVGPRAGETIGRFPY